MHIPVLRDEVVGFLQPMAGGLFVDCTVGLGGHTRALLEAGASRLIGLDRDPAALALARENVADWKDRVELVHADYRHLGAVLDARGVLEVWNHERFIAKLTRDPFTEADAKALADFGI